MCTACLDFGVELARRMEENSARLGERIRYLNRIASDSGIELEYRRAWNASELLKQASFIKSRARGRGARRRAVLGAPSKAHRGRPEDTLYEAFRDWADHLAMTTTRATAEGHVATSLSGVLDKVVPEFYRPFVTSVGRMLVKQLTALARPWRRGVLAQPWPPSVLRRVFENSQRGMRGAPI